MTVLVLCAVVTAGCGFAAGGGPVSDAPAAEAGRDPSRDAPTCSDSDGDTICDPVDTCPGHDDRADGDGDGVADGCDDWPCGARPASPASPVIVILGDRQWTANNIAIGTDRLAVAAPGGAVAYDFGYLMRIACATESSCQAQLEIGMTSPIGRLGCAVDRSVIHNVITAGHALGSVTAPVAPGVYEIRLNAARQDSCGDSTTWSGGAPGGESTIAKLCVH